jgi:hypothetical protein
MSDPLNLAAGAAGAIANLPRKTYTIPETARTATDPTTVTSRHLTFSEEKMAMEAEKNGGLSYIVEGAKRALCAADGNPLTWTNNQVEDFFASLSPKVRDLVERAFTDFCLPNKKEADAFLASGVTSA